MKTFVVIGMGRFGTAVAKKLFDMGHEVMVIDEDETLIQKIADDYTHAVAANAKEAAVLKALGVRNYDCAIVSTAENIEDSVLITLALKDLGVSQVICKARDEQHKKILEKIGADKVIIPEQEMGIKTAVKLGSKNLLDFIDLSDTYGISELKVPEKWSNKAIADLDVRRNYSVNIIAVKCSGADDLIIPDPGYVFREDDIIVVLGSNGDIKALNMM